MTAKKKPRKAGMRAVSGATTSGGVGDADAMARPDVPLLTRLVDLGWPAPPVHEGRGPKPKSTQYDAARDRRKNLYRKTVKLPKARKKAKEARRKDGDKTSELIKLAADAVANDLSSDQFLVALLDELSSRNTPFDESTVRRHLKKLGNLRYRPKN